MSRILRTLLALWFVLSVGEPSVLRTCPMHSSAAAELGGEGDMSGMHMPGHEATHGSHSSGAHHHAHHCSCVNCCVGCSCHVLHSPRAALGTPTCAVQTSVGYQTADATRRSSERYILPPGTGPPRVQA